MDRPHNCVGTGNINKHRGGYRHAPQHGGGDGDGWNGRANTGPDDRGGSSSCCVVKTTDRGQQRGLEYTLTIIRFSYFFICFFLNQSKAQLGARNEIDRKIFLKFISLTIWTLGEDYIPFLLILIIWGLIYREDY